jgi:hypothetical protein
MTMTTMTSHANTTIAAAAQRPGFWQRVYAHLERVGHDRARRELTSLGYGELVERMTLRARGGR